MSNLCLKPGGSDWWIKGKFNFNCVLSSMSWYIWKQTQGVLSSKSKVQAIQGQVLVWRHPAVEHLAILPLCHSSRTPDHCCVAVYSSSSSLHWCPHRGWALCWKSVTSRVGVTCLLALRPLVCAAIGVKNSARIFLFLRTALAWLIICPWLG